MKFLRILRRTKSAESLCSRSVDEMCTHTAMTRVIDTQGTSRCEICDKRPELGWLYVCTQDDDPKFTGEDATTLRSATVTTKRHPLNAWVIKAIEDGHYTNDEVATILQQRAEVLRAIYVHNKKLRSKNPGRASRLIFSLPGFFRRRLPRAIQRAHASKDDLLLEESQCQSKFCHACHPLGLDLAWLSLNKVCSDDASKITLPIRGIQDIPASGLTRVRPYDKGYKIGVSRPLNRLWSGWYSGEFGSESGYEGDCEDNVALVIASIKQKRVRAINTDREEPSSAKAKGHRRGDAQQSEPANINTRQLYAQGTNRPFMMFKDHGELRMDWENETGDS